MANRIKLKRSSVSGNAPTTSDIEAGEVALNMADQVIHYRDGANNIKQIVHGPNNDLEAVEGTFTINADSTLSITDTPELFGNAFNTSVAEITSEGRWPIFGLRHYYGGASNSFSGFANAALQFETIGGTIASPTAVESNKRIMSIGASSSVDTSGDASTTSNIAIFAETTEAQTATDRGAKLTIQTMANGSNTRQDSAIFQGEQATFFKVNTGGIFNTATNGPGRGIFVRNSKNPAISAERNDQGNLADGQTTSSIGFGVRADDTNAFPGFMWMEYADPGNNTFYLTSWDDGVTTFNEQNVMEARADRIFFMEGSLRMQKFTNDVVIKPGPGLAYSFESADNDQLLSISDTNIIVKTNNAEIARFTDNEVSFQKPLSTKGIINTATDAGSRGQFIRNSLFGAVEISRTGQGNLADGQTSSSFQFKIDGDDGSAFPGIVYMDYHSVNGNGLIAEVYDDGVSTFTQRKVIEARADEFKVLEGDLTFTTDGTNQTIAGDGSISIDSYLRTGGMRNTATSGPGRAIFTRNSKNGALELRRTGQGNVADGQTSTSLQFALEGDDANRFMGIMWMEYADPGEQTFYLTSYSNPTNGTGEQTVMEARADRFRLMENSLIFQKFTNDVVIKPGTGLAYTFESADNDQALTLSDTNIIVKTNNAEIMKLTDNLVEFSKPIQLENLTADPAGGANGQMYYNSDTHKFRGYANGSWIDLH